MHGESEWKAGSPWKLKSPDGAVTHTIEREASQVITAVSGGWPKVLSNLKSLLETGTIALTENYPATAAR